MAARSTAQRVMQWFTLLCVVLCIGAWQWTRWQSQAAEPQQQIAGVLLHQLSHTPIKAVALTVDGDFTPRQWRQLQTTLQAQNAKVSIFTNAQTLQMLPALFAQLHQAGQQFGNDACTRHCQPASQAWQWRHAILTNDAAIRQLGDSAPIMLRLPDGNEGVALPLWLKFHQRWHIRWSYAFQPRRAIKPQFDQFFQQLTPGMIIRMPADQALLDALPGLIANLHAYGYQLLTLNELIQQQPLPWQQNPH